MDELLELAQAADAHGHSAAAFEMFRRIITIDPKKDSAIYRAVKNLLELGRISDAECYLNKIRRNAAPKPWLIELALGELCLAQFKPVQAEEHFRNAWKLNQDSTVATVFLANCLLKQEKFAEADTVLMGALKLQDDLEEVYLNLGLVRRAMGDYPSAKQFLLKAIEITPDYPEAKRILDDVESCLSFIEEQSSK